MRGRNRNNETWHEEAGARGFQKDRTEADAVTAQEGAKETWVKQTISWRHLKTRRACHLNVLLRLTLRWEVMFRREDDDSPRQEQTHELRAEPRAEKRGESRQWIVLDAVNDVCAVDCQCALFWQCVEVVQTLWKKVDCPHWDKPEPERYLPNSRDSRNFLDLSAMELKHVQAVQRKASVSQVEWLSNPGVYVPLWGPLHLQFAPPHFHHSCLPPSHPVVVCNAPGVA
jgi:hypothetical protein